MKRIFSLLLALALLCALLPAGTVRAAETAYAVTGGNIYFDPETGTVTDCDSSVTAAVIPETIEGVAVTRIGVGAFRDCSNLERVVLPSGITELANDAFQNCRNLVTVSWQEGLTTIGLRAFQDCSRLQSISPFPSTLKTIEGYAFDNCAMMSSVSFNQGLSYIGKQAFFDCYELTSITLPASVSYIGYRAFANCLDLRSVTVLNPGCTLYNMTQEKNFSCQTGYSISFHGYDKSTLREYASLYGESFTAHSFDEEYKCHTCGAGAYSYDCGVWSYDALTETAYIYGLEEVSTSALTYDQLSWRDNFGCCISTLILGNDVTGVGDGAFYNMTALENVNLVNAQYIGARAFEGCTALESIYIPDQVTQIGDRAFAGCSTLLTAVLRPGVKEIGANAFQGCTSLQQLTLLNPTCEIKSSYAGTVTYPNTLGTPELTVIHGFIPSTAYDYATEFGYQFVALDGCEYNYHSYAEFSRTEPDCLNYGNVIYQCTLCDASYSEVLTPTGHSYESSRTEPTCTEGGFTTYRCHCGDSYTDDFTQPLGHNYTADVFLPTCTQGGYTVYCCDNCGDQYTADYSDPKGHDFIGSPVIPTCTEDGYTAYECICGESYIGDIVPATGHCYSGEPTPPTCTQGGYTLMRCANCADSYITDETPPAGHDYTVTVLPPSCLEGGYSSYTCLACGDSYTADFTPPTGHDFIGGQCSCGATDPDYVPPAPVEFADVPKGSWFDGAVSYAVNAGLMKGMSPSTFEPDTAMSRAMLVTVLWRYEQEPQGGSNDFADVAENQWYTAAVAWASQEGIVNGVGNRRFDPDGTITREQLATILYRYCQAAGLDTSARAALSGFPDGGKVSAYAQDAISWAVAEGLISGSRVGNQTYLDPQGSATRAQVATILMRFIEGLAK